MEDDPDKINDADRALEAHILKAGEFYGESNQRQRAENKKRAENRKRISDLGIRTDAYQTAIKLVKDLTDIERKDYIRDLRLVTKVLGGRQAELFPDEAIKAAKRAERKKEQAAKKPRGKGELDAATDTNPKSNPANGGAAKKPRKAKVATTEPAAETGDELIARVSAEKMAEMEQREGGVLLDGSLANTKAKAAESLGALPEATPMSQSAQAAEAMRKAGLV